MNQSGESFTMAPSCLVYKRQAGRYLSVSSDKFIIEWCNLFDFMFNCFVHQFLYLNFIGSLFHPIKS